MESKMDKIFNGYGPAVANFAKEYGLDPKDVTRFKCEDGSVTFTLVGELDETYKESAEDILSEELMRTVKAMNSKRVRNCEVSTDDWTQILETMYGKIAQTVLAAQANLAKVRLNSQVMRQFSEEESEPKP